MYTVKTNLNRKGTMQEKGLICSTMVIFCQIYMNKRANMRKHTLENKPSGLNVLTILCNMGFLFITGKGFFNQKIKMYGLEALWSIFDKY